jgi:large subunit ribosomal protein L35
MPKMKTRRGAAKRFRKTGTGKLRRARAYIDHYREHKSGSRKRRLQREAPVSNADRKKVRKMLGG